MAVIEIQPDLMWHATQKVNFGPLAVDTRMIIVRLPDRSLWVHRESGTLILADLLFCIQRGKNGLERSFARLLGVHDRLAMSRTMRLLVTDKRDFARSIAILSSYDIQRLILAHDQIVENDAASRCNAAFAWLDD